MISGSRVLVLAAAVFCAANLFPMALAHETTAGSLTISHPWMPEPLRGAKAGAVYLKVRNRGTEPDSLIGAESPGAGSIMLHESKDADGIVQMLHRDSVEIPPQGSAELKPLGIHLMLIGLKKQLKELDTFPITLKFKNAGRVEVDVEVQSPRATHPAH